MKLTIKRWHAVTSWYWDILNDELCGICRVSFDGTCPVCKYPGDECPLVIGECQHAFHMHCILKWLETDTSKGLCPMCRQAFKMNGGSDILTNSAAENDNNQNNNLGENTAEIVMER
ncbi:hypothetical protein PACTADRAFT_76086 [Pachysolen tannophilus NRRL Y-2460]|uniref:Anaphase-promoting complex subunit 11 n=1 Tax=Pachysolen tannophilus NRRL Y-2460 TaxID=669874 RepID=A0A1E4TV39_PACTA|nr:hypothetical protein PACTADRAFT_76086 [Pachysolen tannophilus NRRL Y-2460]